MNAPTSILRPRRARLAAVTGAVALVIAPLVLTTTTAAAADPCAVGGNPIVCENSKPGTSPAEWEIEGAGDDGIQGFATDISVNVGARVDFKIDTTATAYTIDIYRTGWYGGLGARKITSVPVTAALPQHQPVCFSDVTTELYDCGNWGVSASWNVPSTAVSGVYVARLHRNDTDDESHITFVVRNDSSHSKVLFQTSDTTWHAYNTYGGADFYEGAVNGRAYKLSYNRPFATRAGIEARDFYFGAEYPMVRFLERNGYDVTYQSGVDTDRYGSLLTNHEVFLSVGHDEYWSGAQRANVEAARDAGVSLAFFSGNEVYWRTRYEGSVAGPATANRTLVTYKETWANDKIDPSPEWTGTWRDPRYAPTSAGGGRPENGVTGTLYMSNNTDLPVTVTAEEGRLRLWRSTTLSALAPGTQAALAAHTVGYESNEDLDNGSRPAGLIRLSTTTGAVEQYLQDFGSTVAPGTTTHHTTLYRAPSGALVFSAGSIQWSWGLDQTHDGDGAPADSRMQQATVNLLADMGAPAGSLMTGLAAATASTDTTAPTVTITAPAAGAAVANGASVTVTGTAADVGGRVAGVEVSTDAGATWHPATGTTSWSYTYVQHGQGAVAVRVRGIDDSANIAGTPATRSLTVSCPCSVFGSAVPAIPAANDPGAVELGLRLSPTIDGFVTGVRFYKGAGNLGTHTGSLWSTSGQQLASVVFAGETATGWQSATFSAPVAVTAGQTYVVSYTAPQGNYAVASDFFASAGVSAPPLAVAGGFGAAPAGVYGGAGTFPGSSFRQSNYYVDALFTTVDETPLTVSGQSPLPGATSVPVASAVAVTFSKPVQAGSATLTLATSSGSAVAGSATYDAPTRTIRFVPSAALASATSYTATVDGRDSLGAGISGTRTWGFTTAAGAAVPGACPCSFYDDATVPSVLEIADPGPVSLGIRFASSVNGSITGIRFYKGPNNTGTHTGSLWSASGQELATATFTNESATGWQTVTFAQPVQITKDTEYLASYRAPNGRYSAILGAFGTLVREPLRIAPNGGVFTYPAGAPLNASSTSYLVDVVFTRAAVPPVAVATSPAAGALGAAVAAAVSVTFSDTIRPGAVVSVTAGGAALAGTTTLSADQTTVTFQPSAPLAAGTAHAVAVTGVTSVAGVPAEPVSWTFSTAGTDGCPCALFGDQVPATAANNDSAAVELGVSFTPADEGVVTGVRFYKGEGNGGTHTGSLWSATGTRLATVQFANEGASGWQTATFAQPVAVDPGTTYVVSYLAPQGHYASTSGFFSAAWVRGPLTAPAAGNGRYVYGGGFPTGSWNATNYFVDVVFQRTPPTAPTVVAVSPADGATGVTVGTTVTATLSKVPATGTPTLALSAASGAIAGASAFDAATKVVTFTPSAALPFSTAVSATVTLGGGGLAGGAWSFTTAATPPPPNTCPCSLWTDTDLPAVANWNDPSAVQVGVRFQVAAAGTVSGVRFYKGPTNTGTHTVNLWSPAGDLLATAPSAGESPSGWQTVLFASPVAVSAGQTYTAAYHSTSGRYAATLNGLSAVRTAGPLSTVATGGAYVYGTGFPSNTTNHNFWVDLLFTPAG